MHSKRKHNKKKSFFFFFALFGSGTSKSRRAIDNKIANFIKVLWMMMIILRFFFFCLARPVPALVHKLTTSLLIAHHQNEFISMDWVVRQKIALWLIYCNTSPFAYRHPNSSEKKRFFFFFFIRSSFIFHCSICCQVFISSR